MAEQAARKRYFAISIPIISRSSLFSASSTELCCRRFYRSGSVVAAVVVGVVGSGGLCLVGIPVENIKAEHSTHVHYFTHLSLLPKQAVSVVGTYIQGAGVLILS
jgi:hypothetical protein